MQEITPALLSNALACIPANMPRDEWARVGMAIKSEYPDDTGLQLFSDWSASGGGDFDAASIRSTWRSIKAGGGVGVSTLLYLAKQNGFQLPRQGQQTARPAIDAQRLAQERNQRHEEEQAQTQARHEAAAAQAVALWEGASQEGRSAYLERKGVGGFGVRYGADGWLLVPLVDGAGRLWNVQRIAPSAPANGGPSKLFLKGGRKSGLWHVLGHLPGAAVVLVAEGYATAASLHQATGWPVVVAFDAGNLLHVAQAVRALLPAALLAVCGDDDSATQARTGRNPGREKAEAAAQAVQGLAVFPRWPENLPAGDGKDFNDLHQAAGLQAVQSCVQAAVMAAFAAAPAAPPAMDARGEPSAPSAQTEQTPSPGAAGHGGAGNGGGNGGGGGRGGKGRGAPQEPEQSPGWEDPFTVDNSGVWWHGRDKEGNPTRPLWLCSPLHVDAQTRNQDGEGWGYLLTFADPLGKVKEWAMPARMLSGDGGEYRAVLLNKGLRIATAPTARNRLTEFIQTRKPEAFATCTERIGWHGGAFVLPSMTIGDDAERIVFQSESQIENTFRQKRDVADWVAHIGARCVGNSRLVFPVACAFAGALMRPGGLQSGGFHLVGASSSGKTTGLLLAASVFGGSSYMQQWRTTDNALEATAAQHCDSLLILDELSQLEPKVAGECAYMLANEQDKRRKQQKLAGNNARLRWRLLFLSSGELGLADHMAEGGKRVKPGQEVRMPEIPADAGQGMGAFENLNGAASPAEFSKSLVAAAEKCHGAVGLAWLQWCSANAADLPRLVKQAAAPLAAAWTPAGASGQVSRVAARFALVAVAGNLATAAGLTGWPQGESERAVKACFDAWLAARGGAGNSEVTNMLRQVRAFFEAHGEGRFTWWHRAADDHNAKTLMRAGFRRMVNADGKPIKTNSEHLHEYGDKMTAGAGEEVSVEYFVLPEVFKAELCRGYDYRAVCDVLLQRGCLQPAKDRNYDCKPRLPGMGTAWCFRISPAIMEIDI